MTSLALPLLGVSLPFDASSGASTHWRLCSGTRDQGDVTLAAHEYQGTRGILRTLTLAPAGKVLVRVVARTWPEAEVLLRDAAIRAGTYDDIAGLTILGRAA